MDGLLRGSGFFPRYTADTYHQFEYQWHDLRIKAIDWCKRFDKLLRDWLNGDINSVQKMANGFETARDRLQIALNPFPIKSPRQFPAILKDAFAGSDEKSPNPNQWHSHLQSLVQQCVGLIDKSKDQRAARIAVVNMIEAEKAIPSLHSAFEVLLNNGPIYFDFTQQAEREARSIP